MKKTTAVLLSLMIALSGCAGRAANPVAQILPNDSRLSCRELVLEININNRAIAGLMGEQKRKANNNAVAVGVGAIVFFPALFFMNLKGADKAEALAYQRRNQGLLERHKVKRCKSALQMSKPVRQKAAKSAD